MNNTYINKLLSANEEILIQKKQHWFRLIGSIFLEIALLLIIFAATITAAVFFTVYIAIIIAVGFILLMIPLATMIIDILHWTHHSYIITNRRIVQISGVLNKSVTDSSLEKVNDVNMTQSALGRIFGYGDIEILTASESGIDVFKRIDSPIEFKIIMMNAKEALEQFDVGYIESVDHETLESTDIPVLIDQLDHLRRRGILSNQEFQTKKMELLSKL
jgi:uncharacterized membrane protein YdbT with pleckstrin-like domain